MTATDWPEATQDAPDRRIPLPVQMLTVVFYTGFAISVSIVAMAMFGVIGIVLALVFAWQWGRIAAPGGRRTPCPDRVQHTGPQTPAHSPAPSGNASFDAYRDDLMARLEREQADFDAFLARLRDAKDQSEFDRFMDDRVRNTERDAT